jgi:hypothetical protein
MVKGILCLDGLGNRGTYTLNPFHSDLSFDVSGYIYPRSFQMISSLMRPRVGYKIMIKVQDIIFDFTSFHWTLGVNDIWAQQQAVAKHLEP